MVDDKGKSNKHTKTAFAFFVRANRHSVEEQLGPDAQVGNNHWFLYF
jgi:hypothetical protein